MQPNFTHLEWEASQRKAEEERRASARVVIADEITQLREALAAAKQELEEARRNLKSEQEFAKENHRFFIAALDAVGMKGEVGSLAGLQRQIIGKITQFAAHQAKQGGGPPSP